MPLVLLVLRDRPADVGTTPYGAAGRAEAPTPAAAHRAPASGRRPAGASARCARPRARARSGSCSRTFCICGWSTNGLIGTHFIPAAHDHGMPPTTAAGLLALIGVFDIVGTVGSGWLTDRVDPRLLLFVYYALRGLSLLVVPAAARPGRRSRSLFLFIVFYGLDWVATVPPTVALCRTALRARAVRRRVRLGVRLAHGRRRASPRASPAGSASAPATTSGPG